MEPFAVKRVHAKIHTVKNENVSYTLQEPRREDTLTSKDYRWFRYLGRPLEQTDDDWTAVRINIIHASLVLGRLGTLLRREGKEPMVSEIFYKEVVQAILLYESEIWVLLASMAKRVEGTHTQFLQLITGKRGIQSGNNIWETPGAEGVQEAAGTKSARIYIEIRLATVA